MRWAFDTATSAIHVIFFHSLPLRVGCRFQGNLFFIFKLLCLVFARYYLSSRSALENCVLFVNGLRYLWENLFADTRFVLLTQAITYPGSASVQCGCSQTAEFTCTSTGAVCYLHDNINCELMGTQVEKYRSRKRRIHHHMYNGDGFFEYYGLEKKIIFLHLLIFFTYWLDCRLD